MSLDQQPLPNNDMGDKVQQNISGGTFHGPVAAVMKDCVNIINSQAPGERKDLLATLQAQVQEILQTIPETQHEDAADNLRKLVDEVSSDKPKRKWYEISAAGLLDAAKAVGASAPSIASTLLTLGKTIWPDFSLPI